MARQKEFNPDQIINKALALFRLRGYEATSVNELVQHLGIGRGSLYNTFGNKHALYLAALDRYLEQSEEAPMLTSPLNAKDAISAILFQQVSQALEDAPLGGCFFVNSAVELAAHDADVASRVKNNLATGEEAFYQLLSHDPTLALSAAERRQFAQFFINTVLGVRLMAKTNPDRTMLMNVVTTALRVLD